MSAAIAAMAALLGESALSTSLLVGRSIIERAESSDDRGLTRIAGAVGLRFNAPF